MPLVRSPKWAASLLISDGATLSPEALHARLGEVSGLVLAQYNPPKWKPKPDPATPMLWVTGERDAVITLKGSRRSAAYYGADFHVVPGAAHNLMMEKSNPETAAYIDRWLTARVLQGPPTSRPVQRHAGKGGRLAVVVLVDGPGPAVARRQVGEGGSGRAAVDVVEHERQRLTGAGRIGQRLA